MLGATFNQRGTFMATEDEEIFYKIIKAGVKKAVQQGSTKGGLPDDVSKFLASQLSFTFDLLKKGNKLTPGYLAVLLGERGLSLVDIVVGKRYDCIITMLLLGMSLTKVIALTSFTGPAHLAITAVGLLSDCYSVDNTCGISDAVYKEVDKASLPAYIYGTGNH